MLNMRVNIRKVTDNAPVLAAAMHMLEENQVLVGVPAAEAPRTDSKTINNATLAYIHNFGMPSKNIPAKPFLLPGIQNAKQPITVKMEAGAQAALNGNPGGVMANLHAVGIVAVASVKNKISTGPWPPLAASTIAARRRRGRTGIKPLIDTGQLLNAQNYVIRTK